MSISFDTETPPTRPRHSRRWSAFGRTGSDDGVGNKNFRKQSLSGVLSYYNRPGQI